MYAVEKLGSYITRGVYTVSGPFHPFGGAVDIIVVQQQDGSFKSSPWYVRFGKFQGVLKTKEKIVNIYVNNVEAGFNMYLDHKGEAFFLREFSGAEADCVLSPPTSGYEMDVESRRGRVNKVQSFSIESGKREEPVTQADKPNAKIIARTSSRRSILGFMFGRRSTKDNAKIGNMDRVSSLERAEIAADLLETKWSTNLTSNDHKSDTLQEKPSESCESNVHASNQEEPLQIHSVSDGFVYDEVVNSHGKGNGENLGTAYLSNSHSEGARDGGPPCMRAQEEVVQIYESETGNIANSSRSISDCETLECIFRDQNNDSQTCSSDFVNVFDDSLDSRREQLDDFRIRTSIEKHFEEITSTEEVMEIFTLENGHVIDRNEIISETLTLESEEIDAQEKSLDETADVNVCGEGANELEYFNYSGSAESSVITVDSGIKATRCVDLHSSESGYCSCPVTESGAPVGQPDSNSFHEPCNKTSDFADHPSNESGQCTNNSEILSSKREPISELEPVLESSVQLGKENLTRGGAGVERVISDCSVISDKSLHDILMNGTSEDPTVDSSTQLCPSLTCEEQFNITSYLPFEGLVKSETKTIGSNIMTKEAINEKEPKAEAIDYFGNPFQMEETLDFASFSRSASTKLVNSANSEISPTAFGSFNSRREGQELHNHVETADTVMSSSLNISGQESGAISRAREPEDHDDPLKCLEDIQFPCSDTESCGAKENDSDASNNESLAELDDAHGVITGVEIKNDPKDLSKHSLESATEVSRFHSDPINIPACRTVTDGNELSAMSLPIIRSYSSDLEGSALFHPLSCSLDVKSDIYELDVLEKEHSSSSETDLVSENNKKQVEVAPEVPGTSLAAKVSGDQKAIPINADVELSLCKHLMFEGMGTEAARQAFNAEKVNWEKFHALGPSLVKNDRLIVRIGGHYYPWDKAAPIILGMVSFGQEQIFEARGMIPIEATSRTTTQPGGSWRLWPFSMKRSRTISTVQTSSCSPSKTEADLVSRPIDVNSESSDMQRTNGVKKFRSLTPTSEELASLDLKEGANVVKFSFSTPMLGLQQVDARIYLWKWNSHIVISDVDGTITRSDVLGQFMPLVGIDWSQTGVAHLFSAIKENGYQLLFLSARAISQAHLTRQFLFNLKQDGKALPDGPVVISPDGLFPSLYREVIRRAPHEFKISCLEAIKEIFPQDRNPFYAGFGNRDTDEISYLKVGIPLGKIFIINPKGQVAVNRRVDTKSYTSLHELVNAMFPPTTSDEQEDFNSWNYWKMPHIKLDI